MKIEETVCGASALDQLECGFLRRLWLDAKLSFALDVLQHVCLLEDLDAKLQIKKK